MIQICSEDKLLPTKNQDDNDINIDEYLNSMEKTMNELEVSLDLKDEELINELRELSKEYKSSQEDLRLSVYRLVSLFLAFFGLWYEAEILLMKINKGKCLNVYDNILDLLENEELMSSMLNVLFRNKSNKYECKVSDNNKDIKI